MAKILATINMVLNCKWLKPDYIHIKILAHLHKK